MELSFVSYQEQGTKATKRLQRQHVIRMKMREKAKNDPLHKPTALRTLVQKERKTEKQPNSRAKATETYERFIELTKPRPKHVNPPPLLKLSEHLLFTIKTQVASVLTSSLQDFAYGDLRNQCPPRDIARGLMAPDKVVKFNYSIATAMDTSLVTNSISTSLLNQGFQLLEENIRMQYYSFMFYTTDLLYHSLHFQKKEIGQILLKQIYRMACIIHNPYHPYAVWARTLFILFTTLDDPAPIVEIVYHAQAGAVENILGLENYYSMKWRAVAYRGSYLINKNLDQHSQAFQQHLDRWMSLISASKAAEDMPRWIRFTDEASHLMLNIEDYAMAEQLLSHAPKLFDDYFTYGEDLSCPGHTILSFIEKLCYSLTQQGKHEAAKLSWSKSVVLAQEIHGNDHPITINSMMHLALSLRALGLDDSNKAVQDQADLIMAQYKPQSTVQEWNDELEGHQIILDDDE